MVEERSSYRSSRWLCSSGRRCSIWRRQSGSSRQAAHSPAGSSRRSRADWASRCWLCARSSSSITTCSSAGASTSCSPVSSASCRGPPVTTGGTPTVCFEFTCHRSTALELKLVIYVKYVKTVGLGCLLSNATPPTQLLGTMALVL